MSEKSKIRKAVENMSLKEASQHLKELIDKDLEETLKHYEPGAGIEQVESGVYSPLYAGMIVLEKGIEAVEEFSLSEHQVREILIVSLEHQEHIEGLLTKHPPKYGEKVTPVKFILPDKKEIIDKNLLRLAINEPINKILEDTDT